MGTQVKTVIGNLNIIALLMILSPSIAKSDWVTVEWINDRAGGGQVTETFDSQGSSITPIPPVVVTLLNNVHKNWAERNNKIVCPNKSDMSWGIGYNVLLWAVSTQPDDFNCDDLSSANRIYLQAYQIDVAYHGKKPPPTIPVKTIGKPKQCIGNPCDPSTGNKYQQETDYDGGNSGLSFVRHYNSGFSLDNNGMGYGWTHQWGAELEITNTEITVRQADGRGEAFTFTNGLWQGDLDSHFTLIQISNGYTLENDQGTSEHYDLAGHLLSQTDQFGKQTLYSYNSSGFVETVTGPFGHVLSFAYNTALQLLETVTTPDNQVYHYEYDSYRNLTKVIYPDNSFRLYHYENTTFFHALTGISDENGDRYATFAYDADGKAILTQHAETDNGDAQEKFTLNYDSETQTTVTDAIGTIEVLTYTENLGVKNLLSRVNQTDQKGIVRSYDANNNLISNTDPEGNTTDYSYNETNQRISKTEAVGTPLARVTEYQYLSGQLDLVTEIRSPSVIAGQYKTSHIQYNPDHTIQSITLTGYRAADEAVTRSTNFQYNSFGQIIEIDGPLTTQNDISTLNYYECTTGGKCGQLASISNALHQTTSYDSYDDNGRITQITSPLNVITRYTYDARGRITTISQTPPQDQSAPRTTEYDYDNVGQLSTLTFADGKILTYSYDAAHDLRSITDNFGNRIEYHYDLKGNRTTENSHDPDGTLVRTLQTEYDHRNRVKTLNNAGSITRLVQDAVGNLIDITDPNQNPVTTHDYDPLHRLQQTIDALGNPTDYQYDNNDHLIQVKAPNNATTDYLYDDLGNLLEETSADRGSIQYSHDPAGNIISRTDARGITARYQYDDLNRLTFIDYPDTEEDIHYSYDHCLNGIGRLCQIEDQSGITQYQYDSYGNIVQKLKTEPTENLEHEIQYSYDAADRLISMRYPSGRIVDYHRDIIGQINSISTEDQGITTPLAETISYRADGLLTSLLYGNGILETRDYDSAGRLICRQRGNFPQQCYQYDANGNILNIDQSTNNIIQEAYNYDSLDRLIQANKHNQLTEYSLDENGNRTEQLINGNPESYTIAQNSNLLLSIESNTSTYTYSYDANGNIIDDGHTQYYYGANNRLTEVTRNGAIIAQYTYNAYGQRSKKDVNGTITHYLYNQNGQLITEITQGQNEQLPLLRQQADALSIATLSSKDKIKQYEDQQETEHTLILALEQDLKLAKITQTALSRQAQRKAKRLVHMQRFLATLTKWQQYFSQTRWSSQFDRLITRYQQRIQRQQQRLSQIQQQLDEQQHNVNTLITAVEEAQIDLANAQQYISELQQQLETQQQQLNDINSHIAELEQKGEPTEPEIKSYVYANGQLLVQVENSNIYYLHNDHLGTPQTITDKKQKIVWQADYDPFGKATVTMETITNNLRFPGQYFDRETGLHYNYFRYYDPQIGRYIRSDRLGLDAGLNTYNYTLQNPIRFTDPTGEIIPALVACALNPVCTSAVRAGVGALIGGLSAFAAAVNDPCFNGSLSTVIVTGAAVGGFTSFVPGIGTVTTALTRGAVAGFGGNTAGQLIVNGGTDNYSFSQATTAGVVGATSLAIGNVGGFNAAFVAVRTPGIGSAQALATGESVGASLSALTETTATLTQIEFNRNNNECGCGNP